MREALSPEEYTNPVSLSSRLKQTLTCLKTRLGAEKRFHHTWLELMTAVQLIMWSTGMLFFFREGSPTEFITDLFGFYTTCLVPLGMGLVQVWMILFGSLSSRRLFASLAFSWWLLLALLYGQTVAQHAAFVYVGMGFQEWLIYYLLGLRLGVDRTSRHC